MLHNRLNLCNFAIGNEECPCPYLMRLISLYIFEMLLVAAFMSCSGKDVASPEEDTTVPFVADTVMPDTVVVQPKPTYATTYEQLSHMRSSGHWDKYSSGILPQMASEVPKYCRQILESEGKRFIVVDKGRMRLFLYDPYGNIMKSYGIACAKNYGSRHKAWDSRTTEGCFNVVRVENSTEWLFTDENGHQSQTKGQYGPRFIRLSTPAIGIHGTSNPASIGKRVSHGCIRVTNENILDLVQYVEPGMTVIVSPGPRDMAVNESEGYHIPAVTVEPGGSRVFRELEEAEQIAAGKSDSITVQGSEMPSPEENLPVEENLTDSVR